MTDRADDRWHRRIGTILGAVGAVAVAGCTGDDAAPDGAGDDPEGDASDRDGDELEGPAGDGADPDDPDAGVDDGDDGLPDSTGDDVVSGDDVDDGGIDPTGDDDACTSDALTQAINRREDLRLRLDDLRFGNPDAVESYKRYTMTRDQLAGEFSSETVEVARAVGSDAREATVLLNIFENGDRTARATGWFVDEALIVTNAHNVYDGEVRDLTAMTMSGDEFDVDVLGYEADTSPDLALLEALDYRHDAVLSLESEESLEQGQPLVQTGNPGSYGYWVIALGRYVSSQEYLLENDEVYRELTTTVPGREGVSGSPVVTLDGDVVGVTYAGSPLLDRPIGEPAPVAPPTVFDTPLDPIMSSHHVGSDTVMVRLDQWS